MTSLYVDRRGVELKVDGEALVFYENQERIGTVPLAPLERIFIRGDVGIQAGLLGKLGARGIGVVVLSGRKGEASLMLARPHNDAARRVAQYHLCRDDAFCLKFAQTIVELKLREQESFLLELRDRYLQARYELSLRARRMAQARERIDEQTSIAALRGLEGHAAAQYFAGLAACLPPALKFKGRMRRPPPDPFNAVLSLGYTLLHADAVLTLYGCGLDPYVGFYHALDFGRESLACDIVEPLRPLVDRFAVDLFRDRTLRVEDFSTTAAGCMLGKAARARFYPMYEERAETFRKRLTDQVRELVDVLREFGPVAATTADSEQEIDVDAVWEDLRDGDLRDRI